MRSRITKLLALTCTLSIAACDGGTVKSDVDAVGNTSATASSGGTSSECDALAQSWPSASVSFENEVLTLVNQQRAQKTDCHSAGVFGPVPALTLDARLNCTARAHAQDMVENKYFDHNSQNGETPFQRMTNAGYTWSAAGENIAAGQTTPQQVMSSWVASDGHCANIMGNFVNIGIGYYQNDWVQDFGTPAQ